MGVFLKPCLLLTMCPYLLTWQRLTEMTLLGSTVLSPLALLPRSTVWAWSPPSMRRGLFPRQLMGSRRSGSEEANVTLAAL